jgi:hypothetical protein
MNNWMLRRLIRNDFDHLLELLLTRQYLRPHEPIAKSLNQAIDSLGVCPGAVAQAIQWLQIDPQTSVGRLRRTELTQLARSIHRFWRQRSPEPAVQSRQSA